MIYFARFGDTVVVSYVIFSTVSNSIKIIFVDFLNLAVVGIES
jgi:hypothetical protein